jgi:antibiotic biosynthesis monooxygenase (ABM) superfamily enzyme
VSLSLSNATSSGGSRSASGFATVVLGQRVKRGRGDDFEHWQNGVDSVAATFAGFLGTEVTPPADEARDWSIVYRFDSVQHLNTWLGSTERRQLLDDGADVFESSASQQVLVGERDEQLVTVVVTHRVSADEEQSFLAWQQQVTDAERKFAGFRGSELFRPVPGVQESWTAMYRFASAEDLDRWLESSERADLIARADHFHEFELRRVENSFGSWFSFAGDGDVSNAPSSWKTALSVLVGLYPTVVLLRLAISRLSPDAELWESLLLGNILSVGLLTWVVMPNVTRALRFWLAPAPNAPEPRTDVLGAIASIAFLTVAALVFWLVTVAIWTLP